MSPYRARASAKMRMRIIPTKSLGCCALALQCTKQTSVPGADPHCRGSAHAMRPILKPPATLPTHDHVVLPLSTHLSSSLTVLDYLHPGWIGRVGNEQHT